MLTVTEGEREHIERALYTCAASVGVKDPENFVRRADLEARRFGQFAPHITLGRVKALGQPLATTEQTMRCETTFYGELGPAEVVYG